jgi:NAD(P)-dependent dehydrogenase (short-subunit alcohol dehydrogenase family)
VSGARTGLTPPGDPGPSRLPRSELFEGALAVVTGAAQGIGAGIARALAYHGARVVIVDIDENAAAATNDRIVADGSISAEFLRADVTQPGSAALIAHTSMSLGGADVLVNNVGDFRPSGPFLDDSPAAWEQVHALNFGHVIAVSHAILPSMAERGHGAIVNVSSVEGLRGCPGNAVYGAYKAAVIAFTASLAVEVGQYGVRVNCIAPDFTDTAQTPMWASTDVRYADHVGKWVPVGRFGHVVDHGDAVVFLAGPQAEFVTGSCLRLDGGTLAAPGWFSRDGQRFTNLPRPLK